MDSSEIVKITIGSAGILGILTGICFTIFRTGKIVQKIETMDKKFEGLENKIDKSEQKMDERIHKLEHRIDERIDKLEQKTDERIHKLEHRIDERIDKLEEKISERFRKLEDNLPTINIAITRLEVRLEERTLKMVDIPKREGLSGAATNLEKLMHQQ